MSYRLGLLLCDHALEHLAPRWGEYPALFERAFAVPGTAMDWRVYDVTRGELPTAVADCDGYLVSGSRHGAYDDLPWLEPLSEWLRRAAGTRHPLVGLCFGHQIIGQALGGRVVKARQGWGIGLGRYQVLRSEPWMDPPRTSFVVPVCHQDQVVELPRGAARLARNDHCENFVVRFPGRVLGIQGHPEFEPGFLRDLIAWRREVLPAAVHNAALASLELAPDSALLTRWILNFLDLPLPDPESP